MSDFDNVEDINKKFKEAAQKRAVAYHDVFVKSESGQLIMQELMNKYCMSNVPVSASEREVGMHDGGREVVLGIIAQLNIATGENK